MANQAFKVGDGVHWGYNGDAYPGTVVRVNASGRKVWVSRDTYKLKKFKSPDPTSAGRNAYDDYEFTTVERPEEELQCYSLRKSGFFHLVGSADNLESWSLQPGRVFRWNPSF